MKENLEYVQEKMRDISNFGHLALDGIPKDIAHITARWIKDNPDTVAKKREEWKKQALRDEVNEEVESSDKEDQS